MAYIKTTWKNKIVERPKTFRQQQNADGTVTLIPTEGNIIEPGTPVNAQNMNKIEEVLSEFDAFKSTKNKPGGLAGLDESGSLELAIGDMKQSLMPLDNTWLKCDGDSYSAYGYEELYKYLGSPTKEPFIKEWVKRPFENAKGDIFKVVYFKDRWIALAFRGQTWYSLDDGRSWESGNPIGYEGVVNETKAAKILNGVLYVVYSKTIYKTVDGINWSSSNLPFTIGYAQSIDYGNGKFVALNDNGEISTSLDSVIWTTPTKVDKSMTLRGSDISFVNGLFYLVVSTESYQTYYLYSSPDGVTCTSGENFSSPIDLLNVNNTLILKMYNGQGSYSLKMKKNSSWSNINIGVGTPSMSDMIYHNGIYLISCYDAKMATSKILDITGWVLDTSVVNGGSYHSLITLGINQNTGVIMGMGSDSSINQKPLYVNAIVDKRHFTLPNINNYTYIKAKGV